jgi:uncharacterized protein (TIGR00661 family)
LNKKFNFNGPSSKLRIFLSPLDWGLGHATRCIPIIKTLLELNCAVIIGADKASNILLKKEFPTLEFIQMRGYEIKYSRKIGQFYLKILLQLPRIITVISNENRQLHQIIEEYKIDAVISDNRFGLHSRLVPCVYITHQIQIKTGNFLGNKIATWIHRRFMNNFSIIWIPDYKLNGLAGELSHPKKLPGKCVYLGALSRFKLLDSKDKIYDILISLSGPEPQRTIFEEIILAQCDQIKGGILLVRGLPGISEKLIHQHEHLTVVNHLSANELNIALAQSDIVIARSGYTTIMDLAKLNKKAILIPTPGQTEQEYLANYLMEKKYFYSVPQMKFVLKEVLEKAVHFDFLPMPLQEEKYTDVISEFVASLKNGNFALQ